MTTSANHGGTEGRSSVVVWISIQGLGTMDERPPERACRSFSLIRALFSALPLACVQLFSREICKFGNCVSENFQIYKRVEAPGLPECMVCLFYGVSVSQAGYFIIPRVLRLYLWNYGISFRVVISLRIPWV